MCTNNVKKKLLNNLANIQLREPNELGLAMREWLKLKEYLIQLANEPYFMKNEEWYYYDEIKGICKLTDKALPETVKSYEAFYELLDKMRFEDD